MLTPRALADALLAALFSPPCAACGTPLAHPLASAVCEACWDGIVVFDGPLCGGCGAPIPQWRATSLSGGRCPRCRRGPRVMARQATIGPYEGPLRAILHALKYDRRPSVVAGLAARLRVAGRDVLAGADACVPVPLHWRRYWRRGFNQADWLAREMGLPVAPLLRRTRHTAPQVGLPAAGRHGNVRDAFATVPGAIQRIGGHAGRLPPGLVLVLVDDVATTGATLEACARALRACGAAEVRGLTAARAVRARPA